MPLLSIITINYNNLAGLAKTVDSAFNQTWQEFEYIVIDGGSTDGSAAYLESHSDRFSSWVSEPDKGVYNAMNKGIAKATGEYLLFLNSGDHFFNDFVLQQYNNLLVEKDLIYFNLNTVEDTLSWTDRYPDVLNFNFFIPGTLPHPATFIKRNLFETVGFYDESLKIVSDWKFFMESFYQYNCSYLRIDETLSTFYTDGLSADPLNKKTIFKERYSVLKPKLSLYLKGLNDSGAKEETLNIYLKTLKKSLVTKNYTIFFNEILSVKPLDFLLRMQLLVIGVSYVLFKKGLSKYSKLLKP